VKVEGVSQNYRNGVREYTAGYEQTYSFDTQGLGNMTLKTSMAESSNGKLLGDPLNYQFAYEYESGYAHRAKQIGERYYRYDRNGNVTVEQDGPFETATMSGNADVQQIGDVNYVEQGWGLDPNSGGGGSGGQKYRREYTWDERNRLKESVDMRYQVQYTYDHGGERTGKYAAGTSGSRSETLYFSKMWTWTHSGQWGDSYGRYSKHIFLGESRIATKIVGGDGYHVPGAEQQRQYYYHSDHLGSAQLITNYAGEEYERLEYTPYGELWIEKSAEASVLDITYRFTGKERDEETGNYYYGARYLDPRTSRWLSGDPAMGDYIPGLGKDNKKLPNGGIYNTINFHVYHYSNNNPITYVDPDGEAVVNGHYSFQWVFGYNDLYDRFADVGTRIHGTKFNLGSYGNLTLRLWKGAYGLLGRGGEIGLYTNNPIHERSLTKPEIAALGIKSTTMQMYNKETNELIGGKTENGSYWTTDFENHPFNYKIGVASKDSVYTVNTIEFKTKGQATRVTNIIKEQLKKAKDYSKNDNEEIHVRQDGNKVIIYYGKNPDEL
jgi:RHS repeat-associated protein